LTNFFHLGDNLATILEKKFSLLYHVGLSIEDYNNMDIKKVDWFYGRLIRQRNDEIEASRVNSKDKWQTKY